MKESKSIKTNILFNFVKTLSTLIFPVITFSYASRVLFADGMGRIEYVKSIVAYFTLIAMLGVVNYGTRECAKLRNDQKALSDKASEILCVNLVFTCFAYLLLFLLVAFSSKLNDYSELIMINSMTIGLTALGVEWLYIAMEDYKYITVRTCIVQVISLALMVGFVKEKNDIPIYALIQVLSAGGANIFSFIHSKCYIKFHMINPFVALKKHLFPLLKLFLMVVSVQVFTHMDSTMLGWISGDVYVGYYSAATKLTSMVCAAIVSCTAVLMPRISFYEETGAFDEIKKISCLTINAILMLSIPMAVGLMFTSDFIVILLSGELYQPAIVTTRILSLRIVLSPLNTFIITHLFVSIREEDKMLVATIAAAIGNIVFNSLLIPNLAQNGAAIATILSEVIELCIVLYYLKNIMSLSKVLKNTWQYILINVALLPFYLAITFFVSSALLRTVVMILTCPLLYFGGLLLLKNDTTTFIVSMIKKRLDK